MVEADEEDVEIEEDEDDDDPGFYSQEDIPMNDSADNSLIPNDLNLSLPDIYETHDGRGRKMRAKSPPKKKVVSENENLFIYKDFDTSLTKVKGNIKKLPVIG